MIANPSRTPSVMSIICIHLLQCSSQLESHGQAAKACFWRPKSSHTPKLLTKKINTDSVFAQDSGDEKLKRLFMVYHRARKDFDATPAKTLEYTKSAKFLRDTTENCLAYIAAKQARPGAEVGCDRLLRELRATLEETTVIAEKGSGGKKRRFDEDWENVPQEPARMRGRGPTVAQPLGKSDPAPRGSTLDTKWRPITSRIQARQASRKAVYRQSRKDLNLAERKRLDPPNRLYPVSAGQSVHCVFGNQQRSHAERNPLSHAYGDRYRPTYR